MKRMGIKGTESEASTQDIAARKGQAALLKGSSPI